MAAESLVKASKPKAQKKAKAKSKAGPSPSIPFHACIQSSHERAQNVLLLSSPHLAKAKAKAKAAAGPES